MPGWWLTLRGYAAATHFGPTLAVTGFSGALALASGAGLRTLLVVAAVLTGQLSIGWSNDLLDAGIDRAAGRLDKPVVRGVVSERGLRAATAAAVVLTVPLSLAIGLGAGLAALITTACGWAYNLGLKRTLASPLPYAVAFALTPPVLVALAVGRSPQPQVVLAGALLGLCAHFTNGVKDLDADALTGVRGLPQRLGARTSGLVSAALLLAAAAAGLALSFAVLLARGAQRHAFTLSLVAVAALVAAVLVRPT